MKTEIREFCDKYAGELRPFRKSLQRALEALNAKQSDTEPSDWTARLREATRRADSLTEKIAQQHAYLLIFGPLKSGKSTLMNAISGSYISEVSSLPAYPALVYARHGDEKSFKATTYAGKTIKYASTEEMTKAVDASHKQLAEKILEVERSGETFDPDKHFTDAIRRVDVQAPAKSLAESGSVLVDTPGLYTRMRFGYDKMTSEFRDNASCSIFVVKSDNLFFEKVFDEFNDLLGNFSRIFLVVNIDSSKRDLGPDGSLQPSLESRQPSAIVDAFQALSMSAQLQEAYDSGRLNVYPIDLLKAASRQLKNERSASSDTGNKPAASKSAASDTGDPGFDRFVSDLATYLNSSEYLREFMNDSLKVGDSLQTEIKDLATVDAATELKTERESWEAKQKDARKQAEALDALENIDWEKAFEDIRKEKDRMLEEYAQKDRSDLGNELSESLDRWLESDHTLRALREDYLNRQIEQATAEDAKAIHGRLREIMAKDGGARFTHQESQAMSTVGLRPEDIAPEAHQQLSGGDSPKSPGIELEAAETPVKRSFLDYLMFRSQKAVRLRFYGESGNEFISSAKKKKRIAGKPLEELREKISSFPTSELPQRQRDFLDQSLDAYVEQLKQAIADRREELQPQLEKSKTDCEAELKKIGEIEAIFDTLAKADKRFAQSVQDLRKSYGSALKSAESDNKDSLAISPDATNKVASEAARAMAQGQASQASEPAPEKSGSPASAS